MLHSERETVKPNFLSEMREAIRKSSRSYDPIALEILTYIIHYEPVSLYRITRMLPYGISSIYKKAKRLSKDGLIKSFEVEKPEDRRSKSVYKATVKGIFTCWAYGCLKNNELTTRLMYRWGVDESEMKWINTILYSLPKIISPNDVTLFENPMIMIMAAMIFSENNDGNKTLQKDMAKYIIGKIGPKAAELNGDDMIIGGKKYFVGLNFSEKSAHIYTCVGCNKCCSMLTVPLDELKCEYLCKAIEKFKS
ncbi:MAG: hypothetical protein GU362_06555 [Thaumarchaeota archaeon]|jgi:DNA-binding MarR family transcriptional regulator|nr:hypothetical protein [Nitrososphaerota archaeon]